MITGNQRLPKDDPKEIEEQLNYMCEKRRNEIEKILEKNELSKEAQLKLQIEHEFLSSNVRSVYHRVLGRIV